MRFDLPDDKTLVFETTLRMRWGDMDAMGHLNNTSYFRYLETARIDWLHSIGARPDPKGDGVVILNAFCNFYQQLVYPGDVLIRLYVSDVKEKTFETWATMARCEAPELVCAAGGATTVWVNFPAEKSAPLPQWLRDKLQATPGAPT